MAGNFSIFHFCLLREMKQPIICTYCFLCLLSMLLRVALTIQQLSGRVSNKYILEMTVAMTIDACFDLSCKNKNNCAVMHNDDNYRCYSLSLSAQVLSWAPNKFVIEAANYSIAYRVQNPFRKKPKILWLLDEVTRLQNLGSGGSALDAQSIKLLFKENALGPRPGVSLLYGEGDWPSRTNLFTKGSDTPLLDFSKHFSAAMWIKTDRIFNHWMSLLSFDHISTWFIASRSYKNRMTFKIWGTKAEYDTWTSDMVDVDGWRHVAIVVRDRLDIKFYMEGRERTLQSKITSGSTTIKPTPRILVLWRNNNGYDHYWGTIACVTIFQSVLSESEIRDLKNICP